MIKVEQGQGGLWLTRWIDNQPRPESFFVPEDELAAVIADMLAASTNAPDAARWDTYATLTGNPAA